MSNNKKVSEALVTAKAAYLASDYAQNEAQSIFDEAVRAMKIAALKLETANEELEARGSEVQEAEAAQEVDLR